MRTAIALLALFVVLLHGIVDMSEEIKTNLITHTEYDLRTETRAR